MKELDSTSGQLNETAHARHLDPLWSLLRSVCLIYILHEFVMQRIAFFQYLEYFQACTDNARSQ